MKKGLLFLLMLYCLPLWAIQQIDNGIVFVSNEDLEEGFKLDGSWHFYWQQTYLGHKNSEVLPQDLVVPGNWGLVGHHGKGYGLYTLKIVAAGMKGKECAINMGSICNNYRLYIDGEAKDSAGKFSTVAEEAIPDYHPKMIRFTPQGDTVEIAFEISNYFYREGGLNYTISIGYVNTVSAAFYHEMVLDAFMAGALILMFFYFIAYYYIRPFDYTILYFSLLCLVSALRIVTTGQILIRQMDFNVPWELLFRLEFASIILIPMFGVLYIYSLLEQKTFKKGVIISTCGSLILVLGSVCFNSYYASFVVSILRYYALIQLLFLMFIIGRAIVLKLHPLARLAGAGFVLVFVLGVNDILYSQGLIHTQYLLPVGIMAYVFIQAVVLTRKFAGSFNEVEQLSAKLQSINQGQEYIISQRTAELESYNTIKNKIFAIISHDLRAPIATLSSVLTLAEEADDKTITELRTYFKGIKRSVDNLNLTIENLLSWSQSQINGITLNRIDLDIRKEVDNVVSLYSLVALQKEISLLNKMNGHPVVCVDDAHLNLILRNIISNSLKFTNVGGSISITSSEPEVGFVKLCIADNGTGIHQEKLDHLFNPMVHYTSYGTLNEKGTGMGLMLCKDYIERNGGRITIESTVGVGSKVCLWLPKVANGH
jgi:two-component system sensor histidine kinase ChiS